MSLFVNMSANAMTALKKLHGDAAVLTKDGAGTNITGIYLSQRPMYEDARIRDSAMGGVPMSQSLPVFIVNTADITALGDVRNATLAVNSRTYTIGRVLPDDLGFTALELREVYP